MWRRCWCSVDLNAVLSPPKRDINYVSSGRKMPPRSQEHLVFLVRLTVSLQDYLRARTPPSPTHPLRFTVYIYARSTHLPLPLPPSSPSTPGTEGKEARKGRGSLNFLQVYKG